MAKLVIELEESENIEIVLDKRMSFGSSSGNDVLIDAEGIEAFHAVLFRDESGTDWVKQVSSTATTLINGHSITFSRLKDRDVVQMGSLKGVYHEGGSQSESLQAPSRDLSQEIESLKTQKEALLSELAELTQKRNDVQGFLKEAEARQKQLDEDLKFKKTSCEGASQELAKLELQKTDLIADLEYDKKKSKEAELKSRKALAELEKTHKALEKERETLLELSKQRESSQSQLASSKIENEGFAIQIQSQRDTLAELEKSIRFQGEVMVDIEKLQSKQQNLKREVTVASESFQTTKTHLKETQQVLELLLKQKAEMDSECQQLKATKESLSANVVSLTKSREALAGAERELHEAQTKLSNVTQQVKLMESRLNEASQWLVKHDAIARETQTNIEQLYAKRDALELECQGLTIQLQKWKFTVEAVEKKHERLISDLKEVQSRTLHLSEIQMFLAQGEELWREREDQMERQFLEDQQVLESLKKEIESTQKQLKATALSPAAL